MNELEFLEYHFHKLTELTFQEQDHYFEQIEVPFKKKEELLTQLKLMLKDYFGDEKIKTKTLLKDILSPVTPLKKYDKVAHFFLQKELGQGSFSKVFLATDTRLERDVALKISPDHGQEGKMMASLEHENIVKVYEQTSLPDRELRLASLQYISGPTLAQVYQDLKKGKTLPSILETRSSRQRKFNSWERFEWNQFQGQSDSENLISWSIHIAEALEHAHDQGITHLDVKPGNILLSPSAHPYLTDFNISHDQFNPDETMAGGTLRYMPPEQAQIFEGKNDVLDLDERADIYALGMTLKEGLEILDDQNQDLICILEVATDSNRDKRFKDMTSFISALRSHLSHRQQMKKRPGTSFFKEPTLFALLTISLIPHCIGSVLNISYNVFRTVPMLNLEQRSAFEDFLFIYNIIAFGGAFAFLFWQNKSVIKYLDKFKKSRREYLSYCDQKKNCLQSFRYELIERLPKKLFLIACYGWLPGAFLFPFYIDLKVGGVSNIIYYHFAVNFILSWAIAVTYSVFSFQCYTLSHLFPIVLGGTTFSSSLTPKEATLSRERLIRYHVLAGILPMIMALLILTLEAESTTTIRTLSAILISMAIIGFFFISKVKEEILRWVQILSPGESDSLRSS